MVMEISAAEAADILHQIEQNQWRWLKIKRFTPEVHASPEDRYAGLERHHRDETKRMIEVIQGLCRTIESLSPRGNDERIPTR